MLNWIKSLCDNEIMPPFEVDKDIDYYDDLRKKLTHFIKRLEEIDADERSVKIAQKYSNKICESLRDYYKGKISSCHQKVDNLIKDCENHEFAVTNLKESWAFPGDKNSEIQFFRARTSNDAQTMTPKDMLHLPFGLRGKSGNYRFSIPGVISLYLANTSYGCWIEMNKPAEHDFYVAPVILDGQQRIFNLAVSAGMWEELNDRTEDYVHCWIKLLVLMIATSYRVKETGRTFKSEYIISQSIMMACKKRKYDGVVYFSKRIQDERFALCAINLALFANYEKGKDYGEICNHIKVDEPLNYQFFKQLSPSATFEKYKLRVRSIPYISNIGSFKRNYRYNETEFYQFDEHLFGRWTDKNECEWGNALVNNQ